MSISQPPLRGEKDCRKCNRRRIKCDRSLPGCQKCIARSLDCPGYGITLKWNQCKAPMRSGLGSPPPTRSHETPAGNFDICVESAVGLLSKEDTRHGNKGPESSQFSTHQRRLSQWNFQNQTSDGQIELLMQLYPSPMPIGLQGPLIRRLLHHYDQFLAPQLAWVDSFQNPWRTVILPMSLESPSLLSSVLACAAGDLAKRHQVGSCSRDEDFRAFTHHRDKALAFSAEQMKSYAIRATDDRPANAVLAAIFLLCYHEMKWPESGLWLLHLRAARSVITTWAHSALTSTPPDPTRTFLMQEFFSINAITDITSFTALPSSPHDLDPLPPNDNNAIFMGFLRVIRSITHTQRQDMAHTNLGLPLNLPTLRLNLESAHAHATKIRQSLIFCSPQAERDLDHLLSVFHHSTLLYGYQALLQSPSIELVNEARDKLYVHLCAMKNLEPFAQEMAWPVFILGTECVGTHRVQERAWVEEKMEEIIKINGPLDRSKMMRFLRDWWDMDHHERGAVTWIEVAKLKAMEGESFLVF